MTLLEKPTLQKPNAAFVLDSSNSPTQRVIAISGLSNEDLKVVFRHVPETPLEKQILTLAFTEMEERKFKDLMRKNEEAESR